MKLPSTCIELAEELDQEDWVLERDKVDIQVYSRQQASGSEVIGFKTVSYHAFSLGQGATFLQDVRGAMKHMNPMYAMGEVFGPWPTNEDPNGQLIRTAFQIPFPIGAREFVHGVHCLVPDPNTRIITYTPTERPSIPTLPGYIRSTTYLSGQRLMLLPNGLCRVEHLMTYTLKGRISSFVQDVILKPSHIGAYIKEWRALRKALVPTKNDVDIKQLTHITTSMLEESQSWPIQKQPSTGGEVRVGRTPSCPQDAFRLDLIVNSPLEHVVDVLGDKSLEYLPQWNVEFREGQILETLEATSKRTSWLIRVVYKTPWFLADREYVYVFTREWLNDDTALIMYLSVAHPTTEAKDISRARLYPSVHRCTRLADGQTHIEHILATDLGGKLSRWQSSLLKGGLVSAQCRDMKNQQRLLGV